MCARVILVLLAISVWLVDNGTISFRLLEFLVLTILHDSILPYREHAGATVFLGGAGLAAYASNLEDPLLKHDAGLGDDDSDVEDIQMRPQDAILLVGRSDEVRYKLILFGIHLYTCS